MNSSPPRNPEQAPLPVLGEKYSLSPEEREKVKADFKKRHRREISVALLIVVVAVIVGFATANNVKGITFLTQSRLGLALITVIGIGACAFSLWNWRCPHCFHYLGIRFYPKQCPKCSVTLR
jgi:hypothetical protein